MNLVSRILNFISRTPFSKGFFLIPIILASLFFILASHSALAQGLTSPDVAGMGLSDRSLQDTIVNVINIALGFVSIIALAVIIYGGYVWMTSGGIPQRIALAKKILLSAVIGFIIILTSWAIVQFIFNATGGGGGPGPGPGPGPLPGPVSCMSWKFVDPREEETNVPLCASIQAETLNENLESEATITTGPGGDIQVQQFCTADDQCPLGLGGICAGMFCQNHLPGSVQVKNRTLAFYPSQLLTAGAVYLVSLTSGITNASASRTACPKTWQFTAGTDVDTIPPTVLQVSPKDNNTDVCLAKSVKVQFSEPMDLISMQDVSTADINDNASIVCQEGTNKGLVCALDTDCFFACDPDGLFCQGGPNKGKTCALTSEQADCPATVAACYADNLAALEISPLDTQDAVNDLSFNATVLASDRISYAPLKLYKENTTYNSILRADVLKDRCGNSLDGESVPDGTAEGTTTDDYATGTESLPDQVGQIWSFRTGTDPICTPVIDNIVPNNGFYDEIGGDDSDEVSITGNNFDDIAANIVFNQNTVASTGGIQGCFDKGAPAYTKTTDACVSPDTDWADSQIKTRIPGGGGSSNGAISGGVYVLVDNFDCVGAPTVCVGGTRSGESCDVIVNTNGPIDPDFPTQGCPGGSSNVVNLDVLSPHIFSQSPTQGPNGQWVTLNGTDFGTTASTVRFIRRSDNTIVNGNFPCGPNGWIDTQIIVELPIDAPFAADDVLEIQIERTDGRHSNFGKFTVNSDPLGPGICAISESCGESGTLFNIAGKRFGAAQGASNVIFKNGVFEANADYTSPVSWSDEAINNLKVPTALPDNSYNIIVRIPTLSDSNGAGFNKPCSGTPCDLDTTTPACEIDAPACAALGPTYSCNNTTCMCENNPLPKVIEQNSCAIDTQSPSPYRDQTDACLNAIIGARFNKDMDDATLIKANMRLENCGSDSACSTPINIDINPVAWIFGFTVWGTSGEEGIALIPPAPLNANTYYRVILDETIESNGYGLDGNFSGTPDGSPADDYSWIFKTSSDSCKVNSISTSPVNMSVAVGSSKPITAIPQAENCNTLNAASYDWNWTQADATIATVTNIDSDSNTRVDPNQTVNGIKAGATTVSANITTEPTIPAGTSNITVTNALSCNDLGLTAVWKFDEQDGTVALDSGSSGANDGTLVNDPARLSAGCKFGNCLDLNGTTQYAAVPSNLLNFGTNDFTAEGWIKTTDDEATLIAKQNSGDQKGYVIHINNGGKAYFRVNEDGTTYTNRDVISAYNINDNKWHHIAGVRQGNTIRLYVDGNLEDSATEPINSTVDTTNSISTSIGSYGSVSTYLDGQVDEVRLWNKALDISEIKSIYNQACMPLDKISCSDPNLAAVWKLDENSGIVANDSTANNNDGQLNNNPTWKTGADCKPGYGSCLSFDGNNDYIKLSDSDSISMTNAITMEAWIKTNDADQRYIFSKHKASGVPNEYEYTLLLDTGGIIRAEFRRGPLADDYISALGTSNAADGNWHHVAATFDGANIKIYNNGFLESTTSWVNNISSTVADYLFIGQLSDDTRYFNGLIDEPRIWKKALTQEEIISAMSQECKAGGTGQTLQCTNDVVGLWNFDDGSGTLAADGSRNKNNGVLINNPGWSTNACQFGGCLNFDGANDYVKLPDVFLSTPSAITVEGWFKTTTAAQSMLFSINSYSIYINRGGQPDGSLLPFFDNNSTGDPGWGDYNDGNWHYFAATTDGSTTSLYVDGEFINSRPENISQRLDGAAVGVVYDASANWYNGSIDELRVWNRVLSEAEIKSNYQKSMTQCVEATLMCSDPQLTAVWKMDEGIGVVAGDSTKNNLDGALKNDLNNTGWKSGADCKFTNGKCLEFDGINDLTQGDYINVSDSPALDFGTGPLTIDGWVKTPTSGVDNSGTLVTNQISGAGQGFVIHTSENIDNANYGRLYFRVNADSMDENPEVNRAIYSPSIDDNQWHHFAAVREGTAVRMYIDGVRAGQDVSGVSLNEVNGSFPVNVNTDYRLSIGVYRNGGIDGLWSGPFKGSLDELRIWNKALTDNQINDLWNNNNGKQCLAPQKGSACDLDLTAPQCQPNVGLCEGGDPDLRCSITSCTCQEKFIVDPTPPNPTFTPDSGGALACRNTAITVNFNENIDASTIKTATTTVEAKSPPILSENFDGADSSPIGLAGWTTTQTGGTDALVWKRGANQLYENSDNAIGWFVSPNALSSTTNYRISFDAGSLGDGNNAIGVAWNYIDKDNYYRLIWEDPTDSYAGIFPTRLVLQKRVNGNLIENASVADSSIVGRGLAEADGPVAQINQSYHFYIDVVGTKITVSNDTKTFLSYNDSQAPPILPGKIAFYTNDNDGGIFYDNLVVTEYAPTVTPGTVELYAFQPATGNLIADGDMERMDTDVWQTYATPKIIEKSIQEKRGGKQSLHIVTDDPVCDTCGYGEYMGNEGVAMSVGTVNQGDIVRIHGWVKIIKGNFIISRAGDFGGGLIGPIDWKEFTLDSSALFGSPFEIIFTTYGEVKDSEFYIDDVSVTIERNLPVDISTSVSGSQLTISPKQYLDADRNYTLTLRGTTDPYTIATDVIRSTSGTPLEGTDVTGNYIWSGLTTGTEICKIGKAEIEFLKNSTAGPISYKGSDLFTCAGNSCTDDMNVSVGNQHMVGAIVSSVNGGPLGGPMTYKWTKSTDAPFSSNPENIETLNNPVAEIKAGLNNGSGTLYLDVNGGDAGTAKASANITVQLCENPWAGDQASVPWKHDSAYVGALPLPTELATNFSAWYCRDSGKAQDTTDDLPNLTVQRVTTSPGSPKPMAEYFYYDAGNPNDAMGIRVYSNPGRLPLSEWLDQNANISGGQSGTFNGWQSVKAGRSLYVSAANDVDSGIYMNVYLISYSDKASGTLIGIYNQMISNWKFMVNGITDQDIAKLQRDLKRIADLKTIASSLDNYKTKNGTYPKLDAGTYLPGMSTSVWPSWQASFGNTLQTSIPKDPINRLGNLNVWWKFDETTGMDVIDSGLNGYNGRMEGSIQRLNGSDCKFGGCLDFGNADQITNVIRVPSEAANGLNDFTEDFWIKTTNITGTVLSGCGPLCNEAIFEWGKNGGKINPIIHSKEHESDETILDGAWHHIAWTKSGDTSRVYIDGILKDTEINTNFLGSLNIASGGLVIGQEQDSVGGGFEAGQSMQGLLDELRIWNRALSGSEIALLAANGNADATGWNQDTNSFQCDAGTDFDSHIYQYQYNNANSYNLYASMEYVGPNWPPSNTWRQTDINTPFPQPPTSYSCYNYKVEPLSCSDPNLVAAWKLDENSGIVATDSSLNNNDGQLKNSPTWTSTGCKFGGCLSFDGPSSNDYVEIPLSSSLTLSGAGDESISLWVKHDNSTNILFQQNKWSRRLYGNEWTFIDTVSDYYYPAANTEGGEWHNVAYTKKGDTIKSYVDGIIKDAITLDQDLPPTSGHWWLGRVCSGWNCNNYFSGLIDDVYIWDKALTQGEIISAMNQSCR